MDERTDTATRPALLQALAAVLLVLLFFYGLDHVVMSMQGLPLGWDLAPAQ